MVLECGRKEIGALDAEGSRIGGRDPRHWRSGLFAKVFWRLVGLSDHDIAIDPFHGYPRPHRAAYYRPQRRLVNFIFATFNLIAETAYFGGPKRSKDTQTRMFPAGGRERDPPGVPYQNRAAISD